MIKKIFTKQVFTFDQFILFFVRAWQTTRTFRQLFLFSGCRFYPSCSDYFLEAIKKHGLLNGLTLGFKRICKCQPLCEGGIDKVPNGL